MILSLVNGFSWAGGFYRRHFLKRLARRNVAIYYMRNKYPDELRLANDPEEDDDETKEPAGEATATETE